MIALLFALACEPTLNYGENECWAIEVNHMWNENPRGARQHRQTQIIFRDDRHRIAGWVWEKQYGWSGKPVKLLSPEPAVELNNGTIIWADHIYHTNTLNDPEVENPFGRRDMVEGVNP